MNGNSIGTESVLNNLRIVASPRFRRKPFHHWPEPDVGLALPQKNHGNWITVRLRPFKPFCCYSPFLCISAGLCSSRRRLLCLVQSLLVPAETPVNLLAHSRPSPTEESPRARPSVKPALLGGTGGAGSRFADVNPTIDHVGSFRALPPECGRVFGGEK